jgi:hypothetical protein
MYYLLANGVHESSVIVWNKVTSVSVNIRGLGGGRNDRHAKFDWAKAEEKKEDPKEPEEHRDAYDREEAHRRAQRLQ